jgi:hypothetical protein
MHVLDMEQGACSSRRAETSLQETRTPPTWAVRIVCTRQPSTTHDTMSSTITDTRRQRVTRHKLVVRTTSL